MMQVKDLEMGRDFSPTATRPFCRFGVENDLAQGGHLLTLPIALRGEAEEASRDSFSGVGWGSDGDPSQPGWEARQASPTAQDSRGGHTLLGGSHYCDCGQWCVAPCAININ
jgi:hypothetical protein